MESSVQGVAPAATSSIDEDPLDEEVLAQERLGSLNPMKLPNNEQTFMKCARLWRTIVLSSLGKTLYPYSRYIRTLNLRDLEKLLIKSELGAASSM